MKLDLQTQDKYSDTELLRILGGICQRIYICRNIALNPQGIIEELENIDQLYRTQENEN